VVIFDAYWSVHRAEEELEVEGAAYFDQWPELVYLQASLFLRVMAVRL
jgi:hypothetical protein